MRKRAPHFKTADEVVFEIDPDGEGPRWDLNMDMGYTGEYAEGVILDIDATSIQVFGLFPDGKGREVVFPNLDSSDYEVEQWWYPGYLAHKPEPVPECDCGCGNTSGYHWNFCKRGRYLDANS